MCYIYIYATKPSDSQSQRYIHTLYSICSVALEMHNELNIKTKSDSNISFASDNERDDFLEIIVFC